MPHSRHFCRDMAPGNVQQTERALWQENMRADFLYYMAFMQGIGFIIAGLAPWFSGVLRSISGNYLMDWAFHTLCVVGLMIITLRFAPVRFPQLWVKEA